MPLDVTLIIGLLGLLLLLWGLDRSTRQRFAVQAARIAELESAVAYLTRARLDDIADEPPADGAHFRV